MKEGIDRYRAVAKATLLMKQGLLLSTIAAAAVVVVVVVAATAAAAAAVVTADWATAVSPLYLQLQSIWIN